MNKIHSYSELLPDQLAQRLQERPVAIAAWGALEWHGPHLPFGLDGLVAEGFCRRLAATTGSVLLPTTYLPITSLPHPQSLSFSAEHVSGIWRDLFLGLGASGFKVVCLVSGHYAQGHEIALMDAAEEAMASDGPIVLVGTPLAILEEPRLLDHAARWETSQLLALAPDLVHLERLPEGAIQPPHQSAVLGEDPRSASPSEGREVLRRAEESWARWIDQLLRSADASQLHELYARRRAGYADYIQRYFDGSWEAALERWWRDQSGPETDSPPPSENLLEG